MTGAHRFGSAKDPIDPPKGAKRGSARPAERDSPRPEIHIGEGDYDLIAAFALRVERSDPELSRTIFEEIDRAQIHAAGDLPAGVVAIGSEVEFVDEKDGESRRVTLVLPGEADVAAGRISAMTPMGVGLIGLSEGQSIDWPHPDGRPRRLRVGSVRKPVGGGGEKDGAPGSRLV